ncbi:MAG: phosphotransferase [Gammaproteobacteria bacterium]|nr:phosphotransferase [Gammaproteobacteria bacterium]
MSVNNEKLPWTPEYTIATEQLKFVLESNTSLKIESLCYLNEGWDFFSYLANNEWVIRLPKRTEEADTLNRERELLGKLDIPIQHPVFEIWVPRPIGFHLPFAGYRYIEGKPLSELSCDQVDLPKLAADLGVTIHKIHSKQITKSRPIRDPLASWFLHFAEDLVIYREYLPEATINGCIQLVQSYEAPDKTKNITSCHADLYSEHILVDQNHELTAIIDWADMGTSISFIDFAGSWLWGGERFLNQLLDAYGTHPDAKQRTMIKVLGMFIGLAGIDFGHRENNQEIIRDCAETISLRIDEFS